jgi:hypothetical protein
VFTPTERAQHLERSRALFRAVERLTEHSDGFGLQVASSWRAEVWHWVEAEGRCCPFYRFAVGEEYDGASLLLRVSGPHGAKEILRAAFEQCDVVGDGTARRR